MFRGTAMNFNPECAKAGNVCIAEVEEIVEAGELKPDEIHLSGVFVDRVVKATCNEKRIEKVTEMAEEGAEIKQVTGGRGRIVRRAAKEFKDGMYVANPGEESWRGAKRRAVRIPAGAPVDLRTPRRGYHMV